MINPTADKQKQTSMLFEHLIKTSLHKRTKEDLLEDLTQRWTRIGGSQYDQFHFEIEPAEGRKFHLLWHGKKVAECFSTAGAKMIANILLNDYIANYQK